MTLFLLLGLTVAGVAILGLLLIVVTIARNMDKGRTALGGHAAQQKPEAISVRAGPKPAPGHASHSARVVEHAGVQKLFNLPGVKPPKNSATTIAIVATALALLAGLAIAVDGDSDGERTERSRDE